MADEFDDLVEPVPVRSSLQAQRRIGIAPARVVSRLYRSAETPLRARLLSCLLRPLGPLGLVAVAAGAFAGCLHRSGVVDAAAGDPGRYSSAQLGELASFVEQVHPAALLEFARLVLDSPAGSAAFTASAVVLLLQALSEPVAAATQRSAARTAAPQPG